MVWESTLAGVRCLGLRCTKRWNKKVSHYNDWETVEGVSSVRNCGSWRKYCMRMRRLKRRKGESFGKRFEGVH